MCGFSTRLEIAFDAAAAQVGEALKKGGFAALTDIDLKAAPEVKLDVDRRLYRIPGACNPLPARRAIETDPCVKMLCTSLHPAVRARCPPRRPSAITKEKMAAVLFELFGHEAMADGIAARAGAQRGHVVVRRFPDGECYLRFETDVADRDVTFVANLARPDDHIAAFLFAAATAKELGARKVGAVIPYLPYMRQDQRFLPGEAVTSRIFAHLLSSQFDWLVTVDPHLHRHPALGGLYSIPAVTVSAAPLLAKWITTHVEQPVLLGPDSESEQWVSAVARLTGAPWVVCRKTRHGDRDVTITLPDISQWRGRTVVILDDIIASGNTMTETLARTAQAGCANVICMAIHGIFCDDAYSELKRAGARRIVSTDSVPHESNVIGLASPLADAVIAAIRDSRSRIA